MTIGLYDRSVLAPHRWLCLLDIYPLVHPDASENPAISGARKTRGMEEHLPSFVKDWCDISTDAGSCESLKSWTSLGIMWCQSLRIFPILPAVFECLSLFPQKKHIVNDENRCEGINMWVSYVLRMAQKWYTPLQSWWQEYSTKNTFT